MYIIFTSYVKCLSSLDAQIHKKFPPGAKKGDDQGHLLSADLLFVCALLAALEKFLGLGLGELAKADADAALPFADVTAQRGYIAIAYEIGMTTGATETTFEPDDSMIEVAIAAVTPVLPENQEEARW